MYKIENLHNPQFKWCIKLNLILGSKLDKSQEFCESYGEFVKCLLKLFADFQAFSEAAVISRYLYKSQISKYIKLWIVFSYFDRIANLKPIQWDVKEIFMYTQMRKTKYLKCKNCK